MSMENIIDDFHSGLMPEEERTFKFHIGVKKEEGYFEEDREIIAVERREAEKKLEKELDAYECNYHYQLI